MSTLNSPAFDPGLSGEVSSPAQLLSKNINPAPLCSLGTKLEFVLILVPGVLIQPLYTDHKGPLGLLIALALVMRSPAHMANGVVKHTSARTPPKRQVGNT